VVDASRGVPPTRPYSPTAPSGPFFAPSIFAICNYAAAQSGAASGVVSNASRNVVCAAERQMSPGIWGRGDNRLVTTVPASLSLTAWFWVGEWSLPR
jgi:hypothetical protein